MLYKIRSLLLREKFVPMMFPMDTKWKKILMNISEMGHIVGCGPNFLSKLNAIKNQHMVEYIPKRLGDKLTKSMACEIYKGL
jgi:hypothetical protein